MEIRIQPTAVEQIERVEGKPIREVYPDAEHITLPWNPTRRHG